MGIVFPYTTNVLGTVPGLGFTVYTYGLFLAGAFGLPLLLMETDYKRKKIKADATTTAMVALVCSLIMSKLAVVVFEGSSASLADFSTGHSFQGGVVGAVAGMVIYALIIGQDLCPYLDSGAAVTPLGHVVGKMGCFFSADGCYGIRTKMPWGMSFPNKNGLVPTKNFVHPVPLYEATLSFLIFVFLWRRRARLERNFDNCWGMIILLSGSRVFIEGVRHHEVGWYGLSMYQLWAVCGTLFGIVGLAISRYFQLFDVPKETKERLEAENAAGKEKKKTK